MPLALEIVLAQPSLDERRTRRTPFVDLIVVQQPERNRIDGIGSHEWQTSLR
jgi:hypothetical protein